MKERGDKEGKERGSEQRKVEIQRMVKSRYIKKSKMEERGARELNKVGKGATQTRGSGSVMQCISTLFTRLALSYPNTFFVCGGGRRDGLGHMWRGGRYCTCLSCFITNSFLFWEEGE